MKVSVVHSFRSTACCILGALVLSGISIRSSATPAAILFQDDLNGGIPGWTAVQPAGAYIEGPMLWQYDAVSDSFSEQSNIYTDSSTASTSRRAVMLINDTIAPATGFSFSARLTAGDDDGFGLIWGYENETTFYRATFARQNRFAVGWPYQGIHLDRWSNGVITDFAGGPNNSFINTANRPFDVTIGVTNGLLTIVIVDDPLGSVGGPFTYNPFTDVQMPSTNSAKVGLFSWGQAGGTPRSFRIQNPVLSPTSLTGDPVSQVLSNWSFTTTPSATNDYPVSTGMWSAALGPNGRKVMNENNDSAPENVGSSSTNTPVFAAVAGDLNWSNYVYSVRFRSSDNDGFGILLRWQDRTNWYRVGFRAQASTSGVKQGISVQKNVNKTFDQMFASTSFIPPINSSFDVHASIRTNTLQIVCVVNPDTTSPTISRFGPIDMAASSLVPANLATGQIGVFSWAQYGDNNLPDTTAPDEGTAVEGIKVRQVDGEGLFVSSAYGTPDPPVGLNDLPYGGSVTASVASVVSTVPGVRQLSTGFAGSGSVPTIGTSNLITFDLTNLTLITWKWQTQYQLTTSATAGGIVNATAGPWINLGSNVVVSATANPGYMFTGWSGDSVSTTGTLTLTMTRPYTLTANFAEDSDADGLPDNWEFQYFGNLAQTAGGDADGDGRNNLTEYRLGSNPNYVETTVLTDGMVASRWDNDCNDRAIPGWFGVTNFGTTVDGSFRGLWEISNQNRGANSAGPNDIPFITTTNYGTNASFQGPTIVVKSNYWDPAWSTTFSLSVDVSVGDNDGDCVYFRYVNPSNWYRVTLVGNDAAAPTRPVQGLSIQKRTNGWFSVVPATLSGNLGFFPDPLDVTGYKRFRITVNATNNNFEVRVAGRNVLFNPNDWDPASEVVATFADSDLPTGRIGVGPWGQGGFGAFNSSTNDPDNPGLLVNPVGAGWFIDNIVHTVDGTNAFVEDWETAPQHTDIPAGWLNPYAGGPVGGLAGDWHVSAHGTLANFTFQFGSKQTGTAEFPKQDGEGPILLAPAALTNQYYLLEMGILPFDDGGMGFVYDFQDTNNYSRVMFNSQVPGAGDLLAGVNIGRKVAGVWTNITVGDSTFIYTPGRRFDVRFANNNGAYTLSAAYMDDPTKLYTWTWIGPAVNPNNRVGVAVWDMPDAHYSYFRASSLPAVAPYVPFKITNISLSGGNVVLNISKPTGSNYHVLRATSVVGPYVTNAANQSALQYSEPIPAGTTFFYRLQLLP